MYLIRERLFDVGDDFDITDESGQRMFHVDGKLLSPRDRLVISDASGREVATVHRKLIALRRTYAIEIGGEPAGEMRRNLFTPFRDRYTIDIPGPDDIELRGDLLDHEYTVERAGEVLATVSKKWFRVRDTYAVDVAGGLAYGDHLLVLAGVLALELAQSHREQQEQEEREKREREQG